MATYLANALVGAVLGTNMKVRTVVSSNNYAGIRWVLVHHYDCDIPWESEYDSQEELLKALRNEPDGEAFRVVPRPLRKGETKFVHKEW